MKDIVFYYGGTHYQNLSMVSNAVISQFVKNGVIPHIIDSAVSDCVNCGKCQVSEDRKCHIKCDKFSEMFDVIDKCDGIIIFSPIYFFNLTGKAKSFLDRLYSVELNNKILTCVTISGSESNTYTCGNDIVEDMFKRTSDYCGSVYVAPLNICTHDKKLDTLPIDEIEQFVKEVVEVL